MLEHCGITFSWGTEFGKGGPILAAKIGLGGPFLAADRFFSLQFAGVNFWVLGRVGYKTNLQNIGVGYKMYGSGELFECAGRLQNV